MGMDGLVSRCMEEGGSRHERRAWPPPGCPRAHPVAASLEAPLQKALLKEIAGNLCVGVARPVYCGGLTVVCALHWQAGVDGRE